MNLGRKDTSLNSREQSRLSNSVDSILLIDRNYIGRKSMSGGKYEVGQPAVIRSPMIIYAGSSTTVEVPLARQLVSACAKLSSLLPARPIGRIAIVWLLVALSTVASIAGERPVAMRAQGVIYTGGEINGDHVSGQMQTFYELPAGPPKPHHYPIVFIHGSRLTGSGFFGTPDGREGWATWFLSRGWPVYVVDQPGKGRSGYFPNAYGVQGHDPSRRQVAERFTAPEKIDPNAWPTAHLHTQWPGSGLPGDPIFEQFFASEVANMPDVRMQYALTLRAVTQLLQRIGPAVIVTHSQAGPLSWMIAQANPKLVKAIIAVEPTGNANRAGKAPAVRCGITIDCLDFTPALPSAQALDLVRRRMPRSMGVDCWLQRSSRYRLPWLNGLPILIATGEASYHAGQDYCTSAFLTQAGVANDYIYLPDVGIRGNGHMQMIEKNNLTIAAYYERWLLDRFSNH
jgi:pimeloyl-ACP methyl ester carboxylesterase